MYFFFIAKVFYIYPEDLIFPHSTFYPSSVIALSVLLKGNVISNALNVVFQKYKP